MKILGLLFTAGLVLVILGVSLGIGAKVNNDFSTDSLVTSSATVTNESVSADTSANATLSFNVATINPTVSSCTLVVNGTTDYTPYSANIDYICYSSGTFSWLNSSDPAVTVNVTYVEAWETWEADYNTSHSGEVGLANLSGWSSTIATVVAAVVIIGLLLAGFGGFLMLGKRGV